MGRKGKRAQHQDLSGDAAADDKLPADESVNGVAKEDGGDGVEEIGVESLAQQLPIDQAEINSKDIVVAISSHDDATIDQPVHVDLPPKPLPPPADVQVATLQLPTPHATTSAIPKSENTTSSSAGVSPRPSSISDELRAVENMPSEEGPEKLLQYFITVGVGEALTSLSSICDSENTRPITGLSVYTGDSNPANVELIRCTIAGQSASLRHGYFGTHVWLGISRDPALGEPVTEIVVLREDQCPPGFIKFEFPFNRKIYGRTQTPAFIYYERDLNKVPLVEVIFVAEDDGEMAPPDFWKIQNDTQTGIKFGNGCNLYYKKCPATPLDQSYKPNVVDRYPRKDDPFSPLPVAVAQFCQPNGSVLMLSAPLPTSHDFVLTNALGRRMFGTALTCFEPLSSEVWQKSLPSILEKFPRTTNPTPAPGPETSVLRTLPPKSVTADCQTPEHRSKSLSISFESKQLYTCKSICILSYYPFFDKFKDILAELYRISVSPLNVPLERILSNLFEIPIPMVPRVASEFRIGSKTITFQIPSSDEDFPLCNCSFSLLFRCLSFDAVLVALNALVMERKVILISNHVRLLTPIAQALLSLMFPLEWQYSYIPVLPRVISVILDAPMPVFVGLRQAYADHRLYERPDVVIVNLDQGTVFVHPQNPLPPIPPPLLATLRSEIDQHARLVTLGRVTKEELDNMDLTFNIVPAWWNRAHLIKWKQEAGQSFSMDYTGFDERAARACFIHFFTSLFGSFREHLLFPAIPNNIRRNELFAMDAFLESKPKGSGRRYLKALMETQCFTKFTEERTFPSERDSELKFFDRCCDYHSNVEKKTDKKDSFPGLVQSLIQAPPISATYRVPPPMRMDAPLKSPIVSPSVAAYACFPVLDPSIMYPARPIVVQNMMGFGSAKEAQIKKDFQQAFFMRHRTVSMLLQLRAPVENISATFQTNLDWAKNLLMLVYSSWFQLQALAVDWNPELHEVAVEEAFRVLNRARGSDLKPDESTYRSVLKLCAKFSRAESARSILQLMKDSGIQPSQVTYALFTSAVTEAPISPHTRQAMDDFHNDELDLDLSEETQVEDIILWRELRMSSVSICPSCNSRLSDCEIMSGWNDDPTVDTTRCIVCRSNSFIPQLSIRMSMLANREIVTLSVPYLSPLLMRSQLDNAIASFPKDLSNPTKFRKEHQDLFYNLLWYFFHEDLPLPCLLGSESVVIKPLVDNPHRRSESLFSQSSQQASQSLSNNDDEALGRFGERNRNVMNALTRYIRRKDILNAMRLFLLHRIREANIGGSGLLDRSSVWSHSMFREMDALGAQWFFDSREHWIRAYSEALPNVPRHMISYMLPMDNAPSEVVSVFDDVFRHGRTGGHPSDLIDQQGSNADPDATLDSLGSEADDS